MFGIEFCTKKSWIAYVYLPPEWSWGARVIDMVEVWYSTESGKYIQFRAQRCQKYPSHEKKASNKRSRAHVTISPLEWSKVSKKIDMNGILYCTEMANNLGLNANKNTNNLKKVQIKIVQNSISYKKLHLCTSLSPPEVELEGSSSYSNRTLMKLQCQMFKALYLHFCGTYRHMRRLSFCRKLNFEQFLFDPFFYQM